MTTGLGPGETAQIKNWAIKFSNFNDAWNIPPAIGGKSKGEGVIVLHPDTGYTDHPELIEGDRVYRGRTLDRAYIPPKFKEYLNAKDNLTGTFPSHGTSTATVMISSEGHPDSASYPHYSVDTNTFVTGAAPKSKLIPCRVTDSVALGDKEDAALAEAIYYACSLSNTMPVGVISISLGSIDPIMTSTALKLALKTAVLHGVIICAAAGQVPYANGVLSPVFPGNDENTICVAACDFEGKPYVDGLYGQDVDITAPGVDIWRGYSERVGPFAEPDYLVAQSSGTSYATAMTAAACALWQAHHGRDFLINQYGRQRLHAVFKEVLTVSCHKPSGWNSVMSGAGILDAKKLLLEPLPAP